jgi:hypothetical protein
MWHLIRLSLRRWRSQQQSPVKRVPQIDSCLNVAAQVCDHDMFVPGSSVRSDVSASGRQREANDTLRVTGHGGRLIKNEWSVRNVINRNYYSNVTGTRIWVVCHDGSYRFLGWDSKKSAFVPLVFK